MTMEKIYLYYGKYLCIFNLIFKFGFGSKN